LDEEEINLKKEEIIFQKFENQKKVSYYLYIIKLIYIIFKKFEIYFSLI